MRLAFYTIFALLAVGLLFFTYLIITAPQYAYPEIPKVEERHIPEIEILDWDYQEGYKG